VSLRLRLLLVLLGIYCAGGYFIARWTLDQIRPRYLESMEESLVDVAVMLASLLEQNAAAAGPEVEGFRAAFAGAQRREFEARIFSLHKTAIDLRIYVTDAQGRVLFDSTGRNEGRDFSRWNDVARTLRGQYGARSTRDVDDDDETQVLYVAAPVRHEGRICGVVTAGKPTRGINTLVAAAKRRIVIGAVGGGIALLLVLLLVAAWVIAPLEQLTAYARAVRDGRPVAAPPLPGRTLRDLGTAFEEMRDALEGRQHAERYTQAMAHGVKAPLAAIRGAAELMGEDMPAEERARFLGNIRSEAARIQQIIERLLELSSLEARKTLGRIESVTALELAREAAAAVQPAFATRRLRFLLTGDECVLKGERVLLREALVNLLQNALDFSPTDGEVTLNVRRGDGRVVFSVEDRGPGVPDYALSQVFDRFYSLPRPETGRKSTGLGLALVREIAHLHGGEAMLANRDGGGAVATLWVPV